MAHSSETRLAAKRDKLNIAKEVAAMQQMNTGELRDKYVEVCGESPRRKHKQFMIKRIAWRMQANVEGGLSERARKRAMELANDADLRLTAPKTVTYKTKIDLPTGQVLTRNYKGEEMVVTVQDNGFKYEGELYGSLSAVAKAVTGSHWSGNRFFGLKTGGAK